MLGADIPAETNMVTAGSQRRLLVIDQQLVFVGFARLVARQLGYDTTALLDPRDLIARVQEWRPSVVVVEVALPELDGIGMVGKLAELGFSGQLILATAHDTRYLELARKTAEARGLRVATCLAKPVRTAEMVVAFQLCEPTRLLRLPDVCPDRHSATRLSSRSE